MQRAGQPRTTIIILTIITCSLFITALESDGGNALVRRKRYVVFPEGSSFSIALCMTVHTLTPDNIFTEGLNWGISYDLPNESKAELEPFLQLRKDDIGNNKYGYGGNNKHGASSYPSNGMLWNNNGQYYQLPGGKRYYKADRHYLQRRYRRDLYNKLEVIISAMGFDGRNCILRALCEASQRFMPKGNSLLEEMMRIVFTLPLKRVFSFEPEEHRTYADAHKAGHEGGNCGAKFPGCSFSLIDMALGKYNAPRTDGVDGPYPYPSGGDYGDDADDVFTGTLDKSRPDALPPELRYTMK